jgi:hypothetical protein
MKQEAEIMECKFHQGEDTAEKCVLCHTPICLTCMSVSQQFSYDRLCPKCLMAMGISWDDIADHIEYR